MKPGLPFTSSSPRSATSPEPSVRNGAKAMELATEQKQQGLAESIRAKLALYEAGRPFHEVQPPAVPGSAAP
jgi:hypothetical protein